MSEFPYKRKGVSIENLGEIVPEDKAVTESTLSSSSRYKWGGQTFKQRTGKKYATWAKGEDGGFLNAPYHYAYLRESQITKDYFKGVTAVSQRGGRPTKNLLYTLVGYASKVTKYINKFSDGEIYISSSSNSRSGTIISTAEQDIQVLIIEMCAAGGGGAGGGSSSSKNGGGGGGGGYECFTLELVDNASYKITIGGYGDGGLGEIGIGADGKNGEDGGDTKIERVGTDAYISVSGGRGGIAAGAGGAGGERDSYKASPYMWVFSGWMIADGVGKGAAGGRAGKEGGSINTIFLNNTPEHEPFMLFGEGGVPLPSSSDGGGGGGASALGDGGHGAGTAMNGKAPSSGYGGGGGGGIWSALDDYRGGHGAPGVVRIYY